MRSSDWSSDVCSSDLSAGNIDLSRLQSPQDIKRALTVTESRAGGFHAETRGRISHEETRALAGDLGMTDDDLLRRRQGQALNAEQRSEEHTSELQSLMRISYAIFCLKKKKNNMI